MNSQVNSCSRFEDVSTSRGLLMMSMSCVSCQKEKQLTCNCFVLSDEEAVSEVNLCDLFYVTE